MNEKKQHSELFRKLMTSSGVKPIKDSNRVSHEQQKYFKKTNIGGTQIPNQCARSLNVCEVSTSFPTLVTSEQVLSYSKKNVSRNILSFLDELPFPTEIFLDLHGYTVEKAASAMTEFFTKIHSNRFSFFRISHGIGRHSKNGVPLIKSYVNQWLKDNDEIIAFSSARPSDGGVGVVNGLTAHLEKQ